MILKLLQTRGKAHENTLILLFNRSIWLSFFEWQSDYSIQLAAHWSHFPPTLRLLLLDLQNDNQDSVFSDPAFNLNVAFSFSCSMSPSIIPAGLESKCTFISDTQAMSATTEEADRRQAGVTVTWSFQVPSFPILPSVGGTLNSSHIEIQGVTMVLILNWTLCLWMVWEASRQWFSIPAAQRNPTIQGHAENEDRTNAYLVLTINTSALIGVPHTWIWNLALPHQSIVTLVTTWFSLWKWIFLLENGATDLVRWKINFKNIQNEMKSKMRNNGQEDIF